MRALKFHLSGDSAFFKKPHLNSYCYFTYTHIHKPALLGLFGAILGYKGYGYKIVDFPEYYKKLKDLKVSIVPHANEGLFPTKMQTFNNSTGFASQEKGGNLIVREEWIEHPHWTIYIMLDSKESEKLADMIFHDEAIYLPYLGSSEHFADMDDAEYIKLREVKEDSFVINSFSFEDQSTFDWDEMTYRYKESLPYALDPMTNHHVLREFVLTDAPVEETSATVYKDGDDHIVFY